LGSAARRARVFLEALRANGFDIVIVTTRHPTGVRRWLRPKTRSGEIPISGGPTTWRRYSVHACLAACDFSVSGSGSQEGNSATRWRRPPSRPAPARVLDPDDPDRATARLVAMHQHDGRTSKKRA